MTVERDVVEALGRFWDEAPGGDEPWEPWTPVAGQRVRVVLNGECWYCADPRADCVDRRSLMDGAAGVVVDTSHSDDPNYRRDPVWAREYAGHHFWIRLDGSEQDDIHQFAATELVPLDPDDGREEG